jgi:hypothetical protein
MKMVIEIVGWYCKWVTIYKIFYDNSWGKNILQ